MKRQVQIHSTDHLVTLANCGGYYSCPKDATGKRLGPLVGYAGKYDAPDGSKKQWVGDKYANFAKADNNPEVLDHFAQCLVSNFYSGKISSIVDEFCGAPIGGYSFSQSLARVCGLGVIKAEKKVTALATPTSREQSQLVFARDTVEKGVRYGIVEDVCNNFSTTEELIKLIHSLGGIVSGIFCFLNRSARVRNIYRIEIDEITEYLPVFSLVSKVIEEYQQDDPAVAEDIARGNVVWKPKDNWHLLVQAEDN